MKNSTLLAMSLIGLAAIAGTILTQSVNASQKSQFTQEIRPLYCGSLPDCQLQPPIITSVQSFGSGFVIHGKYDHLNSQSLQVRFNGRTYTLGVDSQLTVDGGNWILDVSDDPEFSLPPGDYEVEVIMVTLEGNTMTYTVHITVSPEQPPEDNGKTPGKKPSVTVLPPLTGFMLTSKKHSDNAVRSFFDSLAVSGVICGAGLGLLVLAWRLNKR